MSAPSECLLFSVGGKPFRLGDLIAAMKLWGDWFDIEKDVRQGISCVKWIEEEGQSIDDGEIESAANEFRYQHDLITSAETTAWLEQWEISIEDWMDYIRRSLLRRRLVLQADAIETCHPADVEIVNACLYTEAVCSGSLSASARKLAARASVHERALEEQWVEDADATATEAVLDHMEASYREFCQKVVTPEDSRDQVKLHLLDWVRFDCRQVSFPTEDMVREALLCIREDGMTIEEVAGRARAEVEASRFYLEDIDSSLWTPFLASQKGDLVGPIPWNDQFALFSIRNKILPSVTDPELLKHADAALLRVQIEHEVNKRVTWHKRF